MAEKTIEQVARETYENCYKIAEIRGDSDYTNSLALTLHGAFTNQINIEAGEGVSENVKNLIGILHSLDGEFYSKFKDLSKSQEKDLGK